jgi:hypothetical protein
MSKTGHEELNLVILRDALVAAGHGHEPGVEIIDRAVTPEKGELVDQAVGERWPEPNLDELDEMVPRWRAVVEL